MVGASWYQTWIDGKWLLEGPFRYPLEAPEFQTEEIDLPAGDHLLAVHARHDGVTTRMLKTTPPYLWCRLLDKERDVPIAWKGLPLTLQSRNVSWMAAPPPHRINPQLGWSDHPWLFYLEPNGQFRMGCRLPTSIRNRPRGLSDPAPDPQTQRTVVSRGHRPQRGD
jgi:hypothetical protein